MSERWKVARLDEVEARGRFRPVREHLGISAFGINAYRAGDDGTIINDHVEGEGGQEELYVVLDGTATFTVDGEEIQAPEGTLVFVRPESRRTAKGEATILAIGATPGQAYQAFDWGDAWSANSEAMTFYGEKQYSEAAEKLREAVKQNDHPGLHYNLACFAALSDGSTDEVFEHLRLSVEQFPPFREQAPADDDFASVRDDPRFAEALR